MRKLIGIVVLVAGTGALGLWARSHEARGMEERIAAAATGVAATSIHDITTRTSGRDITATGIADSEAEKTALLAALNAVDGRRVVNDQLTVLPTATPYTMAIAKAEGSTGLTPSGNVPTEDLRGEIATLINGNATPLTLASGAPEGWEAMVKAAVAALGPLDFGRAELTDNNLKIVGQARTPVEADAAIMALSALPQDNVAVELSLLDDGTAPAWTVDYAAASGATLTGKLPQGLEPGAISGALGLPALADQAARALTGGDAGASADTGLLATLARWLPQLERLQATFGPDGADIIAGVGAGADLDLVGEAMGADLARASQGRNIALRVEHAPTDAADGAHRTNAATGAEEMLSGGFWLPITRIEPSTETCTAAANGVLSGDTINFLSGSDRLDANARAVINRLASVLLPCTRDGGLRALIGGHTDATGDATLNLGLSQRRATTVRLALVARGIPGEALRAQGYGATRPIATNDTEEGKAANRRTTIEFSQ